jgi:hypothetical protein
MSNHYIGKVNAETEFDKTVQIAFGMRYTS